MHSVHCTLFWHSYLRFNLDHVRLSVEKTGEENKKFYINQNEIEID